MPLSVAFRADASVLIGTGHVMRCLTLADSLTQAGARCRFLCRDLPGHRADAIAARGHRVDLIESPDPPRHALPSDTPRHAAWLPVTQEEDAEQCTALLPGGAPDLVVVDHYALDSGWETRMRRATDRILVIDDLADRRHDCDLLLDQNLGRCAADYDDLVPDGVPRLIGPHFALLGPAFAAAREASLAQRAVPALDRLFISLGGVDADNVTRPDLSPAEVARA